MKIGPRCLVIAVFALAAEMPAATNNMTNLGTGKESAIAGGELSAADIKASIKRAMAFLVGKEALGTNTHYSDAVVYCGLPIARDYPEYNDVLEPYKIWITKNDLFSEKLPYQSINHVMALDIIGEREKAVDMFSKFLPIANEGEWDKISYHLGWYLYGCIVAGDNVLLEKTFSKISDDVEKNPNKYQYFTADCLWMAYEKTGDERYRKMFLIIANNLRKFQEDYFQLAEKDAHGGLVLSVFCRAFDLTHDEEYREIARKLAGILLSTQAGNGSWYDKTAHTILPAEGLFSYLKMCR